MSEDIVVEVSVEVFNDVDVRDFHIGPFVIVLR